MALLTIKSWKGNEKVFVLKIALDTGTNKFEMLRFNSIWIWVERVQE